MLGIFNKYPVFNKYTFSDDKNTTLHMKYYNVVNNPRPTTPTFNKYNMFAV